MSQLFMGLLSFLGGFLVAAVTASAEKCNYTFGDGGPHCQMPNGHEGAHVYSTATALQRKMTFDSFWSSVNFDGAQTVGLTMVKEVAEDAWRAGQTAASKPFQDFIEALQGIETSTDSRGTIVIMDSDRFREAVGDLRVALGQPREAE